MKKIYEKFYGEKNVEHIKPKVVNVPLSLREQGMNQTQVTIFNIKEVLTCMISNSDIMNPKNILFFDPRNTSSEKNSSSLLKKLY